MFNIKRWVRNWLYYSDRKEAESPLVPMGLNSVNSTNYNRINSQNTIRFTVHIASGGRVVETERYDPVNDRRKSGLYIITHDKDFGKELDKIITMDCLK